MSTLSERAMNVSLSMSAWRGQRIDRQVTREVLADRQADPGAGRFEKYLVPKRVLDPVFQAQNHARTTFNTLSLPWDDGMRIISAATFFEFTTAMQAERAAYDLAVETFCQAYPDHAAQAPAWLGAEMYDARDYPKADTIRTRFGFRLHITPVPDRNDFRVSLGADAEAAIRENIEQTVTERLGAAQRDLWDRVLDTVRHFAETMTQPDRVFRNTTVTKLGELATLAPKLSLVPDPKLDAICARILELTRGVHPDTLRKSKRSRAHAAVQAHQTLAQIEAAMQGAF